ncbi:MAG: ATP-binding protein [Anaerolineae bacterium]|nr:ATP-binding protein [Anaerolineae bacterium]
MCPPIDWLSDARSKNESDQPAENLGERLTLFHPEPPRRRLADLVVGAETERQLRTALAKIKYHNRLYRDWGLETVHPEGRSVAINLYGPPGTGKSFAAEGIAQHLDRPVIRIDYAQIESRFVGDTPKNIVAAFDAAKTSGAVLFFDEADSVLSRRVTNITQAADYGVNVSRSTLLLQLDNFEGVVLFATNLASNYDAAFVRRILAHVYFGLPDEAALVRLWRYHLPAQMPLGPGVEAATLAAKSAGLSGGDVLNTVILAAASAAERESPRVDMGDFEGALAQVRRARQEIGRSPYAPLEWVESGPDREREGGT